MTEKNLRKSKIKKSLKVRKNLKIPKVEKNYQNHSILAILPIFYIWKIF